ncbi:hypothetical protein ACIP1T_22260 [Pseudomonas japonica]|uniref:hypothetical protein n=1 Tax=Pseudomonas japonica TaxID=256466 RepID=UPI003808CB13
MPLYQDGANTLDLNLELTAAPLYSSYNFGQARERDMKWLESYLRANLAGRSALFGGELYGSVGVFTSKVFGDGDAAGTGVGNDAYTQLDNTYLGWRNDTVDFSIGRQFYLMGDSFLIAGDQLNYGNNTPGQGRSGLYYLARPSSFAGTAIARIKPTEGVNVELFHLESNNDGQGNPILDGINTELGPDPYNQLGLSYIKVSNVDPGVAGGALSLREGLKVYNVRGKTNLGVQALSLTGGYAAERSNQVDAYAWYLGAEYAFAEAPCSPTLGYRYARFSGDDTSTRKSEAFDPLFYGPSATDTAWVQGEIGGTFAGPFNSDLRTHRVFGRVVLNEKFAISTRVYRYESGRSGEHIADETDLYLETTLLPNLLLMPIVGVWKPQDGAEARYGVNDVQTFVGVLTSLTF